MNKLHALSINSKRLHNHIEQLAEIGKFGQSGVCRLALSPEYKEGVLLVQRWMEEAGLVTTIDNFGNLIGRLEGENPHAPALIVGSHIDSQPYGGKYDGTIGVLGGLEAVQTMQEKGLTSQVPIEIIAFCDEEGQRFQKGLFGSRGLIGQLDEGELERVDVDGISRRQALLDFGCDPENLHVSEYHSDQIGAYLELHIEQGPVLEAKNLPVGIVSGVSGPLWLTVTLTGVAGHAGAVPMNLRHDPLVGTSEIIQAFYRLVQEEVGATSVGTVGQVEVYPNARSIIPEKVQFSIDLRDIDLARRNRHEAKLRDLIEQVAQSYQLDYDIVEETNITPKLCSNRIQELMHNEANSMQLPTMSLMSGPFHDALVMADACEFGMIFVRSKGGISHSPFEYSSSEDIALGTELLFRTMIRMAT